MESDPVEPEAIDPEAIDPEASELETDESQLTDAMRRKSLALDKAKATRKSAIAKAKKTVARESARRKLTDPKVMRALAHPLRLAIMEALLREGPLTATAAAVLLDDSPGNMSWHLNVLAKYGFVEEAPGGRGRSRPWRLVHLGTEFTDESDNSELSLAGESFTRVLMDRQAQRVDRYLQERQSYPPEWKKAAFNSNALTYLTADELEKVGDEINTLLSEYRDRTFDLSKRPEGSRPVNIAVFGLPLPPNPSGN
ncbi:MAG: helix-turn-helix domain-containing protein [Acidimicrobiales bacterium]